MEAEIIQTLLHLSSTALASFLSPVSPDVSIHSDNRSHCLPLPALQTSRVPQSLRRIRTKYIG